MEPKSENETVPEINFIVFISRIHTGVVENIAIVAARDREVARARAWELHCEKGLGNNVFEMEKEFGFMVTEVTQLAAYRPGWLFRSGINTSISNMRRV